MLLAIQKLVNHHQIVVVVVEVFDDKVLWREVLEDLILLVHLENQMILRLSEVKIIWVFHQEDHQMLAWILLLVE